MKCPFQSLVVKLNQRSGTALFIVRDIKRKLIHYEIIHRYYGTPVRPEKLGPTQNDACWECIGSTGSFSAPSVGVSKGVTISVDGGAVGLAPTMY